MDENLIETKIDGQVVYDGNFLKIHKDTVRLPNGHTSTREFIFHPGAAVIIPLFDDGTVLLERQFRYPMQQVFIELPAGKKEASEPDALKTAQRELLEETGYTAKDWQFVCTIHNAIGYANEHLDIFLAKDLTAGERHLDVDEFVDVIRVPVDELMQWIKEGKVTDVKTMIGAFWLEKIIRGEWQPQAKS